MEITVGKKYRVRTGAGDILVVTVVAKTGLRSWKCKMQGDGVSSEFIANLNEFVGPALPPKPMSFPKPLNAPVVLLDGQLRYQAQKLLDNEPSPEKNKTLGVLKSLVEAEHKQVQQLESNYSAGQKHLVVVARAGTGKSSTIEEAVRRIFLGKGKLNGSEQQEAIWAYIRSQPDPVSCAVVAFNRAISEDMQTRFSNAGIKATALTCHKLGKGAVNRAYPSCRLDKKRTDRHIEIVNAGRDMRELLKTDATYVNSCRELVRLAKLTLSDLDDDALRALATQYEVPLSGNQLFSHVREIMELAKKPDSMNFEDMLWLPVVLNLQVDKYDLLFVDEAQDLSRVQQELVLRSGCRIVLVGDQKQAIYGFAGADTSSIPTMVARLRERGECVEMPLTVTWRCGKEIVKVAQKLVEDFVAHESNCEGEVVRNVDAADLPVIAKPGDMIICRVNAPLLSLCFRFVKANRKAYIQGRAIGENLWWIINGVLKAKDTADLMQKLDDYIAAEVARLNASKWKSEDALILLHDRVDCIKVLASGSTTIQQIKEKIDTIFSDDNKEGVCLSSIHRAKGREADTVFIAEPNRIPHPMAKTKEAQEQEKNLYYVAVTRAKSKLVFLSPIKSQEEEQE